MDMSARLIFLANLAAIVSLTLVLAFDVNTASAVLFPAVVGGSQVSFFYIAQFAIIHLLVVVLASIFSFFAIFAITGVLMSALPYSVFRRISLYVRVLIIVCLLTLLATSFAVPSLIDHLAQTPHAPIRLLPSVWFLGLCQLLRGKADPSLALMGRMSIVGTLCVAVLAIAAYAISYRRCFIRIPETLDLPSQNGLTFTSCLLSVLDRTVLKTSFQRAGYRFVLRTLAPSERHALVLAGFVALGFVIASQVLFAAYRGKAGDSCNFSSPAFFLLPFFLYLSTLS